MLKNCNFTSFLDFFFPNLCLHCFEKLEKRYFYFCKNCLNDFSFIPPVYNCECFAVFEKEGSISTLLKEMRRQHILAITKIAAAFIVIQFNKLKWEMPDVIFPMSKGVFFKDSIFYLSKEVSKFLKRPITKKSHSDQVVLVVSDVMTLENFEEIKQETKFKKIYGLGLCFDIFFDDFYLSK